MARLRFPWIDRRYLCTVLDEMRALDKVKNYGPLASLIEEAQIMAQAMEDALRLQKEITQLHDVAKEVRKLIKAYDKEIEKKKPNMTKIEEILEHMRDIR